MSLVTTWFSGPVPLFLPGFLLWTLVSVVLSSRAARALDTSRPVALLLLVSLGFGLSATLSPTGEAFAGEALAGGTCDLRQLGLPPLSQLTRPNDVVLNIILFVPMGIALGLLPRSRRTMVVIAAAFTVPLVIETLQLVLVDLGRGCESADVINNMLGVAVGIGIAVAARLVHAWLTPDNGPTDSTSQAG